MSLPILEIETEELIYSPYSGILASPEDGSTPDDPSLLFTFFGNAGLYDYISKRVLDELGSEAETLSPEKLAKRLPFKSGFVLSVNTNWNGVNFYGFATPL